MSTDRITFPAHRHAAIRHLVTATALYDCAEMATEHTGKGEVVLRRPFAVLSRGEKALWQALSDVSYGWSFDHDRLRAEVDADNYAAVCQADALRREVAS